MRVTTHFYSGSLSLSLTGDGVAELDGGALGLSAHDAPLLAHLALDHAAEEGRVGAVADGDGAAGGEEEPDGLAVALEEAQLRDAVRLGHGVGQQVVVPHLDSDELLMIKS